MASSTVGPLVSTLATSPPLALATGPRPTRGASGAPFTWSRCIVLILIELIGGAIAGHPAVAFGRQRAGGRRRALQMCPGWLEVTTGQALQVATEQPEPNREVLLEHAENVAGQPVQHQTDRKSTRLN